ncbi:MAG: hypothetical protein IPM89_12790 [Candidatus Competibacteraceae bacterium]|nr:MAG: hypothetical protein IPM89_12790 [Candidatus Competibacteraceae bacterium]
MELSLTDSGFPIKPNTAYGGQANAPYQWFSTLRVYVKRIPRKYGSTGQAGEGHTNGAEQAKVPSGAGAVAGDGANRSFPSPAQCFCGDPWLCAITAIARQRCDS